jgi:O-antigen/teichoic acid export membrane protein
LLANIKQYVIYIGQIAQQIIFLIIFIVLTSLNVDIVIVRLVGIVSIIVKVLIITNYCKWKYPYIKEKSKDELQFIPQTSDAFIGNISGVVINSFPVIVASIFLTMNDVSVLSVYTIIITGIGSLITSVVYSFQSYFGQLIKNNDPKIMEKFKVYHVLYLLGIVVLFSTSLTLYTPFINIYTSGADITYNYPLLGYLLVTAQFLYYCSDPLRLICNSAGLFKESKMRYILSAAIFIIIGIPLGIYLSLNGIFIAKIITALFMIVAMLLYIPKFLSFISLKHSIKIIIIAVLTFFLCILVDYFTPKLIYSSIFNWIINGFIFVGINIFISVFIFVLFEKKTIFSGFKKGEL